MRKCLSHEPALIALAREQRLFLPYWSEAALLADLP